MPEHPGRTVLTVLLLSLALLAGCEGAEQEGTAEDAPAAGGDTTQEEPLQRLMEAGGEAYTGDLPAMRERGVVRALVTYSRTDFFLDHGRIRGIQADFLNELEKQLNAGIDSPAARIRIRYLPVTFDQLIPALNDGLGDIAAAFLTVTPERRERVDFAASKRLRVEEIVVTHDGVTDVASLEDLAGREVYVLNASSYAEHLRSLSARLTADGHAPVDIIEADPHLLSEDILEMVNAGIVPITVVDAYRARLWAKVLPAVVLHEDLRIAEGNPVGWAVRHDAPALKAEIERLIDRMGKGSLIGNVLFEEYFENERWIRDPTRGEVKDRLHKYLHLFRKYGERYGHDELALAALAFQESGLKHSRRSHRGAVGIMQLLPGTAAGRNVGIPDISDVEDNIHAGAKYLAFIRDRYFSDPDMDEADRRALTWAAYNAGPARVRRMRELAAELGLDPDAWFDNVEVAAGRMVGRETVEYVANVQKYYVAYRLAERVRAAREQAREAGT